MLNTIWRHRNGNTYVVLLLANEHSTKYPVTVVYQGTNGNVLSRPLDTWHDSMTEVQQLKPPLGFRDGICRLLADAHPTTTNTVDAVAACLADGFEYYSGDDLYPIEHPWRRPYDAYCKAYDSRSLWDTGTCYGRRRHAALEHVNTRRHKFSVSGNILVYNP